MKWALLLLGILALLATKAVAIDNLPISSGKIVMNGEIILGDRGNKIGILK